jgi:hypothetical protein
VYLFAHHKHCASYILMKNESLFFNEVTLYDLIMLHDKVILVYLRKILRSTQN